MRCLIAHWSEIRFLVVKPKKKKYCSDSKICWKKLETNGATFGIKSINMSIISIRSLWYGNFKFLIPTCPKKKSQPKRPHIATTTKKNPLILLGFSSFCNFYKTFSQKSLDFDQKPNRNFQLHYISNPFFRTSIFLCVRM